MQRDERRRREGGRRVQGAALAAAAALSAALVLPGLAQAPRQEPNRGGALDLDAQDPKVALERIKPAAGYEVSLFASEKEFPELANPLAMTFDTRGRLWVLTSPTYPHIAPGEEPRDKLIILEDANGDGRADSVKVFADDLYIPTGFELGDGGVYVSQQPNLVFLKDTNGDDRADERRIILHGFGTEDSHHSIHAYTWGPDGALYFQEGTFLHSQVETPYGPVRLENAGVFRYEPRTEKLSVFVSYAFANPWGHVVDRWGQNFISDASNGYNYYGTAFSGHMAYPNKHRAMQEWTLTRVRPTSGIEFVRSRHFPDEAQGNFLYNNVIGFQGIKQYRVKEEGSGFVAVEIEPLLQSTDINFRPVALQFGPDGALYVVDWFNPLIGHMQYSLRDTRRDKQHGRVWRITAKGRKLVERPRIHGQPIEAQLELLKAYEDRTRYQARLALRAQPTATVLPAVRKWIAGLDPADAEYEHHLLEALWVHQHHDVVETELLSRLLEAKEFRARAAAVRVLHHWFDRVDGAMGRLAKMVRDPAPRVRLEAVRALSFVPAAESAEAALAVLQQPMDYYLRYVLDATMRTLEPVWKPALVTGNWPASAAPAGLEFVLARLTPAELARMPRSTPVRHALLARPGIEAAARRTALEELAAANGTRPTVELVRAVDRIDGEPGSSPASGELMRLLLDTPPAELDAHKSDLDRLARQGRNDAVRQGAFAALLKTPGGADRAWALASASPRALVDLMAAASLVEDRSALAPLRPRVRPILAEEAPAGRFAEQPVAGRYVRLVLPGQDRSLRVAEVQVFAGETNVASQGTATQSSTVAGGAVGGHAPNALDGRLEDDGSGKTVSFTSPEQDPWWEVDLGRMRPIDTIAVWRGGEGRGTALHLTVLDEARTPVFSRDGVGAGAVTETIALGGDFTARVHQAAMSALAAIPGQDEDTVTLLAGFLRKPASRHAAMAALRRIPEAWSPAQAEQMAADVLAYIRAVPAAQRTGTAFADAVEFGRDLAAKLTGAPRATLTAALDELVVRTIRIVAVRAQMKYDIGAFTVEAGQPVEIVFVNEDEMPHNLLITRPGAMETVSLAAEEMMKQPDAFAKHFVPDTKDVLFSTKLINEGETARLRFTAPKQPDGYPFVCTFPGHWRTMNGVMNVVRSATQTSSR